MEKHRYLLMAAVAIVAVLAAIFFVLVRAPVPADLGTAPSVVRGRTETPPDRDPAGVREAPSSANAARAQRGSGVEGVTSGGTTDAPAPAR